MDKISSKQLTTINLRYGNTAKSLKVLAYANLSAKALLLNGDSKSLSEIAKNIAEIINVKSVSEDLVESGLKELLDNKKVYIKNKGWSLKDDVRQEMENEIEIADSKFEKILERHFSKKINKEILKKWFNDAIVNFFEYHGDEWVQTVCKGAQKITKKIDTLDDLLTKSTIEHKLQSEKEELNNSFRCLLLSEDIEDQSFVLNIGYAMFSARLVAADIGAEPIVIDELKNATFVLDTNILFPLHLEGHRLTSSFETLGKALSQIGATLKFIDETREEYGRVWFAKKAETLNLLNNYPVKVIKEADDDFTSTAVCRGCDNQDDFERFYQSIANLPKKFPNGPDITVLQDQQIEEVVKKSKSDSDLKVSIQRWCQKIRPFWNKQPKSKSALDHDAALVYVTEFENKQGNKTFILTLDRSLQASSSERAGNHGIPSAIYLEGLIQILAANNAGPDFDSTNFAPLMSNLLIKKCIPPDKTYNLQDLHWLYNIQKNVAGFSPEKIQSIALEVMKARLSGKTINDNDLQRNIHRLYQEETKNTDTAIKEARERARVAEEIASKEKEKRILAEGKLSKLEKESKIEQASKDFKKALLWRIPATIFLSLFIYKIINLTLLSIQTESVLDYIIGIASLFGFAYKLILNPFMVYRKKIEEINK